MKTVITSEYEALFRQHFRLATLYAERIVGSAHEAEDIVQEAFLPASATIIKGAKNMDNAKLFIDFILSEEVQLSLIHI